MSALPEITLVVGIDAKTIQQLEVSWPTWKKNRPQMWHWPWIIFYDGEQLSDADIYRMSDKIGLPPMTTKYVPWPPPENSRDYESQREKMLAGFVFVPAAFCKTRWFMKLDCDALARPCENWLRPEFFEQNEFGKPPVYIASRWGYTKGYGVLGVLDDWGDRAFPETKSLGIRKWDNYSDDALRVGHARMCSWVSFYLTEFAYLTATACERTLGKNVIPVPSQDSLHWFVAARLGMFHRIVNFKKYGWSNHSRIEELRRVAAEIMADQQCAKA